MGSVLGDWNGIPANQGRFHEGIDLPAQKHVTPVVAPADGCVRSFLAISAGQTAGGVNVERDGIIIVETPCNSGTGWAFGHVVDIPPELQAQGAAFTSTMTLAYIGDFGVGSVQVVEDFDHVHMGRIDINTFFEILAHPFNFYLASQLPPQLAKLNDTDIFLVPDGTFNTSLFMGANGKPLKDDIDIVVSAHTQIRNFPVAGVYSAEFEVLSPPAGSNGISTRKLMSFHSLNDASQKYQLAYAVNAGAPSDHFNGHYILTNSGNIDPSPLNTKGDVNIRESAWYTTARQGAIGSQGELTNAARARANPEAEYKDGTYKVRTKVYTYKEADSAEIIKDVKVRNFTSVTKRITIRNGSETLAERNWTYSNGTYTRPPFGDALTLSPGTYTLELEFTSPMAQVSISATSPESSITIAQPSSADPSGNQKVFAVDFEIGESATERNYVMSVTGQDLGGDDLLAVGPEKLSIDASTELALNSAGDPIAATGPDTSVGLDIAGRCFLVENEKLIFSRSARENVRNRCFGGVHYYETRSRCITAAGHPAGGQA